MKHIVLYDKYYEKTSFKMASEKILNEFDFVLSAFADFFNTTKSELIKMDVQSIRKLVNNNKNKLFELTSVALL